MLKLCAQPESSSLQMVGFLSVLAISGSFALISLMGSKSKLLRQGGAQDSWTTLSQEDFEEEEEEEVHPHSHGDFHSQEDFEKEEEEEEVVHTHSHGDFHSREDFKEEEEVHTHSHGEANLPTHSLLDSSYEENEHLPTHFKSLHEIHEPTRATLKRKKKVRFASDVVEPPSNGQQYRSKWRVSHICHKPPHLDVDEPPQVLAIDEHPLSHHQHYKSKRRVSHGLEMRAHFGVDDPPCNDCVYVDASAHNEQQYKSTCKVSQRDATHARLSYHQMPSKLRKNSQGCEMHGCLSQPPMPSKSPSSIPANRLALYKGLRESRLQYSLHRL